MGQIGLLVRTEVKRIVGHAGISPVMSQKKLGEDLVAALVDLVAKVSKSLLRVTVALGHLLMAWWPLEYEGLLGTARKWPGGPVAVWASS